MIGLGVLGCADIAVRRILPAVSRIPGLTVTAVGSRDGAKARKVARRFAADAVEGYAAVLDRPDVDAVYVPLPPALHAEWVERALRAGKHVLAEKPLTTDPAATRRLVALAAESALVLRENHLFLHHGQHRHVGRLLGEGAVGELREMRATFAIPPRQYGDIRYRADLGGGALFDVGTYPVRAARLLLGPGLRVAGAFLRHDHGRGVDIGGGALLVRPDGVTAHLSFGMDHFYTSSYEVLGSAGRLRLWHAFTPPPDHVPVASLERPDGTEDVVMTAEDQCAAALTAFADMAEAAGAHGAAPDPAIVDQAELLDRIRTAAGAADETTARTSGGRHHG